jgi:hypothetical protein
MASLFLSPATWWPHLRPDTQDFFRGAYGVLLLALLLVDRVQARKKLEVGLRGSLVPGVDGDGFGKRPLLHRSPYRRCGQPP